MTADNDLAIRRALEDAGVEFNDENGGGPGVRLRKKARLDPAACPGPYIWYHVSVAAKSPPLPVGFWVGALGGW